MNAEKDVRRMKLAIGSDHAGFEMKCDLMEYLKAGGHEVEDCGCYSPEAVDYPDIASAVAERVVAGACENGILICGTGIGISIAANKVRGIRCAAVCTPECAALARQHNNANVLAFGARTCSLQQAEELVDAYLSAEFLGGRHAIRVEKITALEHRAEEK